MLPFLNSEKVSKKNVSHTEVNGIRHAKRKKKEKDSTNKTIDNWKYLFNYQMVLQNNQVRRHIVA